MGKWGHFSPDGREYIITRPDTPRPWINYLTNGQYCAICSHTGGGYSFVGDPGYNRITREHPGDEIYEDRPGRYIYVHELASKKIWSLGWQPVQAPLQSFESRVGLGYTSVRATTNNLASDITYFVPRGENIEFWMVNLQNKSSRKRTFRFYTYAELTLGNFHADLIDRSFENLFNHMWFKNHILYGTKTRWNHPGEGARPWDKIAFITVNLPVDGYESLRERFLGQYRYLNQPKMVVDGEVPHQVSSSGDAAGILCFDITLNADEEAQFDVMLGAVADEKTAKHIRQKYLSRSAVENALDEVRRYWDKYNQKFVIKTPDDHFNTATNVWNRYQCWVTSQWSEMDSYYIPGSGVYGFRDEAQHIFGLLPHDSDSVRVKLQDLLIHQFKNGMTVHNWDTYTKKGTVTKHSDDAQWLVMAILNYLKETGDLAYLDEIVPYYDGSKGSVMEHLLAGLNYTIKHFSPRGIPLRQTADWNDALGGSDEKSGESMMVANMLCWNIRELLPILAKVGPKTSVTHYQTTYHNLFDALNKLAWDGQWYIRATTNNGDSIGSHSNTEGMIHLNGQTWPIISGVADFDDNNKSGTKHRPYARGQAAMKSVWKHLMTKYGPAIFQPPYTKSHSRLGIIAQFTPGTKENGTIFLHPVAWSVIAECILGNGDEAYEIWRRTSFITRSHDPEYKSEPYVYPEYVYGPAHPKFGQGSYTWITGSAAWFYRACTDWILGVRPTLEGLMIDPCVPKKWSSWTVERDFREARYIIQCQNPHHLNKGVKQMEVDGKIIAGNILPDFRDHKDHIVKVTLTF